MYTAARFRATVIDPTLQKLQLYSLEASDLLLGTAIQESGGFVWNKQLGGGPARGYFQMEGATHDDIWKNYLKFHHHLAQKVKNVLIPGEMAHADTMMTNHAYAAAMARIKYYRVRSAIPSAGDLAELAKYWKKYYNTPLGAGSTGQFVENWLRYNK